MIILHGINNCNTVKQTKLWFAQQDIEFSFQDFKKQPPTIQQLQSWCSAVDWQILVNKKGTTWRKLDEKIKAQVINSQSAITLMLSQPSIIKRPIVEINNSIVVGYQPEQWQNLLTLK